MFLASPIWLVLLAPWAGLALWLLWGQLDRRAVPYLKLWRGEMAHHRKPSRQWHAPPPALIALLAATLLGIVAAAGPMIRIGVNAPAPGPEPAGVKNDHRGAAARRVAWPAVEAASPLPPELRRMIEVYTRHRPPGEGSQRIAVLSGSAAMPAAEPAAIVADDPAAITTLANLESLTVADSPLTQGVDWEKALNGARVSSPPSGDWQPVVVAGGAAVVAVRQQPVRQVWVGFESDDFPRRAGFRGFLEQRN